MGSRLTLIDLPAGTRNGRLTVVGPVNRKVGKHWIWLFHCSCGNLTETRGEAFKAGRVLSCGCLQKDKAAEANTKHGAVDTPTYSSWEQMKARCENPNNKKYYRYGARGIKVCLEWRDFAVFKRDMGEKPKGYQLGRIDNDGPYCKENCRWETPKQQMNNTSRNKFICLNGVTKTIAEWARIGGLNYRTLSNRVHRGCPLSDLLTPPTK